MLEGSKRKRVKGIREKAISTSGYLQAKQSKRTKEYNQMVLSRSKDFGKCRGISTQANEKRVATS
jgi:hypothetical protein